MRKLIILMTLFLAGVSSYAQDKGMAVMSFNLKTSMDAVTPNEAYGSEWAYVVEDSTMYIWSRTDSVWNRYSGNQVTTIASSPDTVTITNPVRGDIAYISPDSVYFRSNLAWLFSSGGSGGSASTNFPPRVWYVSGQNFQLADCETSKSIPLTFYILDDTVINTAGITFEIDASPASITYDQFDHDSTYAIIQSTGALTAGVKFVEFTYTDFGGESITWLDVINVDAGRPDTVTVFDPPGQDSILVTRVCGAEVSRDTISTGDNLPGNNTVGTVTDGVLPVADADTLKDSYLSQVSAGLVLAANKCFQLTGWATAGEPAAGAGLFGYDTDKNVFRMSDGVTWYSPAGVSTTSGKLTVRSIPFTDSDGYLTEDAGILGWNATNNYLALGLNALYADAFLDIFTTTTSATKQFEITSSEGGSWRIFDNAGTGYLPTFDFTSSITASFGGNIIGRCINDAFNSAWGVLTFDSRLGATGATGLSSANTFSFRNGSTPQMTIGADNSVLIDNYFKWDGTNDQLLLTSASTESWPLTFLLDDVDGMEFQYNNGSNTTTGQNIGVIQWRPRYGGSIQNEVAAINAKYKGDGTTRKGSVEILAHTGSELWTVGDFSTDSIRLRSNDIELQGTGALQLHTGTTAQQPIPELGEIRGNSTTKNVEITDGTNWFGVIQDGGSESDTTDGSGDITVSHSIGTATIFVAATATGTTFYNVQVHTKTSTTFKIRFFDAAGSAVTSTAVTADWIAKK